MMYQRRRVQGYIDFGKHPFPILPYGIVLTDRDDGTLWLLSYNTTEPSDDNLGYFAITDTIPSNVKYRVYAANDEPMIGQNPELRLLVRGGYLGYEVLSYPQGITDFDRGRIFGRKGNHRVPREIVVPDTWQREGDMLAWAVED